MKRAKKRCFQLIAKMVASTQNVARKRKYTVSELLAECDPNAPMPRVDGWDEMLPVGRELP